MARTDRRVRPVDDGRGRNAHKPTAISWGGWRDILTRAFHEFSRDRVTLVAAGVAFYGILALVPALAAFIAIFGLLADPSFISEQTAALEGVVPEGGREILDQQISRLVSQNNSTLGLTLAISVAISLWSANAAMKSLFQAMNVAYDEREKRGFLKLNLITLGFTLGALLSMFALVILMVGLPAALGLFAPGPVVAWAAQIGSYVAMFAILFLGVSMLYRFGPSRVNAKWRWVTPGASFAVTIAVIASILFSWYAANFGSYNATYGSLGALIGFMTWLWIMNIVIILGAELDAEMEHQTAIDSTKAPDRPMGERGAQVADHLGAAVTDG